ncbi:MAG: PQQ-binding-like beta-propeller repeat protein [Verrucomicrobiota bacterium]|nr:PQQ-binding-like beta-propeller repeat protein [Verrucomicrobiota bacterium]
MPLGFIALGSGLQAADWPQYLGPNRDGIYPGEALTRVWPSDGPNLMWRKRDIGTGMSGVVAAKGRLILFHEVNRYDTVECLDAETGKTLWKNNYASSFVPGYGSAAGPRATPAIAGDRVYTMGGQGIVVCTDMVTGKIVWKVDTKKKYRASDGFFGMACSPLVEGNALLLNIGGEAGAGIVALDKDTGKLLWKSLDDEASYSSPVMAKLNGKRRAVFFTRTGLAVVDPVNGTIDFQNRWRARIHASVNASAPLVAGDRIFVTASYNTGALVLQSDGNGFRTVWSNDTSLSSQYASVMHRDGFLYGTHGRADVPPIPALRCVELATGKVSWSVDDFGDCLMLRCGDRLLALMESGELVLGRATPAGWQEISRAQIIASGARSQPALANGRLFIRDRNQLVCLDVR